STNRFRFASIPGRRAELTPPPTGVGHMPAKAAVAIAGVVTFLAMTSATQWTAATFAYQRAPGAPLVRFDDGKAIYWPWSVFFWSARWADEYPRAFALAHIAMLIGGGFAVVCSAAVLNAGPPRLSRHGASGWAGFAEATGAGLFASQGAVLGKLDGEILA